MQPVREYVQIIFSYMSEANATLGDETQRVKYVQTVREGGGTPATERLMQSILDTAMDTNACSCSRAAISTTRRSR